jgi:anaerobic ribonucleoside-triphosphate reductase activating protein
MIKKCDIANGEGIRVSLFVSGCRNRCKGCFQPETWDFNYGREFDRTAENEIFQAVDNPSVRGLTILGGEPMEPENQAALLPFLLEFKSRFADKTLWIYTGNTLEELLGNHRNHIPETEKILSLVDVLVDGRFEEGQHSLGLRFRGSKNQRVIDMNLTREQGEIIIWAGCMEDKVYESKN